MRWLRGVESEVALGSRILGELRRNGADDSQPNGYILVRLSHERSASLYRDELSVSLPLLTGSPEAGFARVVREDL